MGTIIGRTRKDGSKAFTAQIVIKHGGVIAHREAQTFDRKQAANAWVVKREAELKSPGGLERKEDPTLAVVIDRYIEESRDPVSGTKAQVLKTVKFSDLGETKCSAVTAQTLVAFARELNKDVEPQTCGNYFSHLSNIFTVAGPAWGYSLSRQQFDDAVTVIRKLGLIGKATERSRRPTLEELVGLPSTPKGRLASTDAFCVFGCQVNSLTDCRAAAARLMCSFCHIVVKVKNIGCAQPVVLNPAHSLKIQSQRVR